MAKPWDNGVKRLLMAQGQPASKELLALTRLFASLAFKSKEDQEWLGRRFAMLKDILTRPRTNKY